MNKFLTILVLITFLALSMAGNHRNLGKKYSSYTPPTAVVTVNPDMGQTVAVTVEEANENVGENVPKDLGTTTTTKIFTTPDGTVVKKQIITVHKTCLDDIVTITTTTKTIIYNNNAVTENNTEVEVEHEAEQEAYPIEEESYEMVNEADNGENVVVVVEEAAAEENQAGAEIKDLGTTVTTKIFRTDDGTIIKKQIITVHKTCENGIITTKTIIKTITWTPKPPVIVENEGGTGENVVVVVPEAETENNYEYPVEEECDTMTTTVMEAETPDVGENVVVVVEEQEQNVGEEVPKDLGKTVTTKIFRLPDGTIIKKQIITVQKTCLNGIVTITTTTKTITYNKNGNTEHHTEVAVEQEAEENYVEAVPVESNMSENVVVVVNPGEENMMDNYGEKW